MAKKLFGFFMIVSIVALALLVSVYFKRWEPDIFNQVTEGIVNVPTDDESENEDNNSENSDEAEEKEETVYNQDVYSVHLCDRYSDGTFSIRNIKLGMTFRQVVNFELKNIGVYVDNDAYDKSTFEAMSSKEGQGKDMLPVTKRALLGNACEILYNFSNDITIEEPSEYPYLESVQFSFVDTENGVDKEKKIEDVFSDCFGKPVIETEGRYSTATFVGTKEKVTMFYEYIEDKETISLRHILWEKFEE